MYPAIRTSSAVVVIIIIIVTQPVRAIPSLQSHGRIKQCVSIDQLAMIHCPDGLDGEPSVARLTGSMAAVTNRKTTQR